MFYEDLVSDEQFSRDFLIPFRYLGQDEIKLTEHVGLGTFYGVWRYLHFVSLVDIALLHFHCKGDSTILPNSLVRATGFDSMVKFIEDLGVSKQQAVEFLETISSDVRDVRGHLDLQYRPALRIAQTYNPKEGKLTEPEMVYLPALVATSNVMRNVQAANMFRIKLNAERFVSTVAQTLRTRFANVETNRPVKDAQRATDIDVIVLEQDTLFLFECKHSLFPTGPHELRDIWEEIEKGVHQLELATEILGDPARRQSYLTGWFPRTKPRSTAELRVVACVLCSHRIFSGLHHKGFPIRDFSSLARLCDDGIIGMGGAIATDEVVLLQYRVICGLPFLQIPLTTRTFRSLGMVRRLTWTVKDEEISLHSYPDPTEAQHSLERFRWTYNFERPHQALAYSVPADLFCRKSGPRSIY